MSTEMDDVFDTIMDAKDANNYAQKLPQGTHSLLLKRYQAKKTQPKPPKNQTKNYLSADFMITATNSNEVAQDDTRGWPWFIEGDGWAASYAQTNAKGFNTAVMKSVDLSELPKDAEGFIVNPITGKRFFNKKTQQYKTEHDVSSIGELLALNYFRGLQIAAVGTPSINKKTKQVRMDEQTGKPYVEIEWRPVPGQTLADIAEMREMLDQVDPLPEETEEEEPAPQTQSKQQTSGGYAVNTTPATTQQAAPAAAQQTAAAPAAAGDLKARLAAMKKKQ